MGQKHDVTLSGGEKRTIYTDENNASMQDTDGNWVRRTFQEGTSAGKMTDEMMSRSAQEKLKRHFRDLEAEDKSR